MLTRLKFRDFQKSARRLICYWPSQCLGHRTKPRSYIPRFFTFSMWCMWGQCQMGWPGPCLWLLQCLVPYWLSGYGFYHVWNLTRVKNMPPIGRADHDIVLVEYDIKAKRVPQSPRKIFLNTRVLKTTWGHLWTVLCRRILLTSMLTICE